jgi:hypothetical protein
VRVNGEVVGTRVVPVVDVNTTGTFMFIGGQEKPNGVIQALRGYIAEFIVVGGAVTPSELTSLEAYLKAKYAL